MRRFLQQMSDMFQALVQTTAHVANTSTQCRANLHVFYHCCLQQRLIESLQKKFRVHTQHQQTMPPSRGAMPEISTTQKRVLAVQPQSTPRAKMSAMKLPRVIRQRETTHVAACRCVSPRTQTTTQRE